MQFTQLDHVGAPVWDANAATAFYERAGVPVVSDEVLEAYGIRAVFLDFDGIYLEFLEPTGPGKTRTYLERHGPGYSHVAYRVGDIDATVDALRADGVTFDSEAPRPGAWDSRIIFVEPQHTAGFEVELVEREP